MASCKIYAVGLHNACCPLLQLWVSVITSKCFMAAIFPMLMLCPSTCQCHMSHQLVLKTFSVFLHSAFSCLHQLLQYNRQHTGKQDPQHPHQLTSSRCCGEVHVSRSTASWLHKPPSEMQTSVSQRPSLHCHNGTAQPAAGASAALVSTLPCTWHVYSSGHTYNSSWVAVLG